MLNLCIVGLVSLGLLFFLGTSLGLIRFPDFYSRMHAAGKGDTLSSVLLLTGLALYNLHHPSIGTVITSAKILFIVVFIFVASPTATHAIMDAGFEAGIKHWTRRWNKDETRPDEKRHHQE